MISFKALRFSGINADHKKDMNKSSALQFVTEKKKVVLK